MLTFVPLQTNKKQRQRMKYGICPLSVVPIRQEPADMSEIVTQLLFGEVIEIIRTQKNWAKVRCLWDDYVGWMDCKQYQEISEEHLDAYNNAEKTYSLEMVQGVMTKSHYIPVVMGSTLPLYDGMNLKLTDQKYTFSGQVITPKETMNRIDLLVKIARKYLYAPYLWGGRSPFGIDCSGFTQVVFKMIGIALKRDASQQVHQGKVIDFVGQAKIGDVAFFENPKGRVTHVGIVIELGRIIHASGQVRIDALDHQGIFNFDTQRYTHKLKVIKRLL